MQNVVIRVTENLDFRTKEAYKTLRTNLSFAGKDVKVIAVTSCTPDEGKTSVSFQLSLSMAEDGKKTILVDADLRKSVLRGRFRAGHEKYYGLSHYLSGQAGFQDLLCTTDRENLDVIFAGPVPPNPSELLGSSQFDALIGQLKDRYDCVIVDTPPLGSVIDGAVVSRVCDGTVLVIESGNISYRFAQSVKDQLEKAGSRILGCVLNKAEMTGRHYYRSYYKKYYGGKYGGYYGGYYGGDYGDAADDQSQRPALANKKEDSKGRKEMGKARKEIGKGRSETNVETEGTEQFPELEIMDMEGEKD